MNAWREEWARNPRLRLGVLLIVAIVGLWALLAAADALDERVAERDRLVEQVQRLRSAGRDERWLRLRDDARVLDAQWRGRAWREPTEGRMQAAVQDWLRAQCEAAKLVPRELAASVLARPADAQPPAAPASAAEPVAPADTRIVRARLVVELSPLALHELLARLIDAPGMTRLTRLDVQNTDRKLVELELEALFVPGEHEARP
ncbi:hypothetical protein LOC51_26675 [Rubrivivax sp. JA1024]|nr:hypothetical protein [Rubrivivax sp. JA1024]